MQGVTIREYRSSDFDALSSLWLASWRSAGVRTPVVHTLTSVRRRLPKDLVEWSIHLAVRRQRILGFVALKGSELDQLFVHPAVQSRGIGKGLLDFVKHRRPDGFWLSALVQNYRARRFYKREGLIPGKPILGRHPGHRVIRFEWRPDHPGSGKELP
jgi:ribosomal protein S18 acetylase RimI-like enzyme